MLGYIIEPVALRRGRNVSYREFFDSIKIRDEKLPHNYGPKVYKPGEYNCQMNELMFQAGPRCKRSERAKRAHSLYIYIYIVNIQLVYSATQQENRFLPLCTSCSLYLIKLHAHEPNLVHS